MPTLTSYFGFLLAPLIITSALFIGVTTRVVIGRIL